MKFAVVPASHYSLTGLVALLNRGFEEYFIPIYFNVDMFSNMLRKDGIELGDSRVLVLEDQPCGIALVARRPSRNTSRLAAMGIAIEARGKGAGSWLMNALIEDACERGDHEMVLEVIEQNEPAVKLYRKYGFESVRRLVGFTCRDKNSGKPEDYDLHKIELQEIVPLLSEHGFPNLPWQLSGESIAQMIPAPHAYRKGQAYLVISDPDAEHVVVWSLLVAPKARGQGRATDILKHGIRRYPGKTWHVPAIFPEEMAKIFERAGFERETLSQWQMRLNLRSRLSGGM